MFPFDLSQAGLNLDEKYLCLDFSNTVDWRKSDHPDENLEQYTDLLDWGKGKGLLPEDHAEALRREAERHPEQAQSALAEAIRLRESLYRMFSAAAHKQDIPIDDLDNLNGFLSRAMARAQIVQAGKGFAWQWREDPHALDSLLWPIARSAGDLLTSPDLNRVGECANEAGCGWLFYDTSRNHSRRWCSMESCGNRAKAQRHYHRQKPVLTGLP